MMRPQGLVVLGMLWLSLTAATLHGQTTQPASPSASQATSQPASQPAISQAVAEVLAQAEARTRDVHDLTASFTQTRTMMLLRKPLVSQGRVNMRGDITRWTTQKPQPQVMRTSQGRIEIFHPDQKLVEVYDVDARLTDLAASPLPRLKLLGKYFDITLISRDDAIAALRFAPREEKLASHIRQLDVSLDLATGLAREVVMTNADDETTRITFTDVRTNAGLEESDVALKLPAGTRVTHPLEKGQASAGQDEGASQAKDRAAPGRDP